MRALSDFMKERSLEEGFLDYSEVRLYADSPSNQIFKSEADTIDTKFGNLRKDMKTWHDANLTADLDTFKSEIESIWSSL